MHDEVIGFCNTAGDTQLGLGPDGGQTMPPITSRHGDPGCAKIGMQVGRLSVRECERLQGFPDDWTAVPYRGKPAADGPRYKALGNSMACNAMQWLGERIALVDGLIRAESNEAASSGTAEMLNESGVATCGRGNGPNEYAASVKKPPRGAE